MFLSTTDIVKNRAHEAVKPCWKSQYYASCESDGWNPFPQTRQQTGSRSLR